MPDPYELHEYLTVSDRSPFNAWLRSLRDRRARAHIRARLDRVQLGNLGDYQPLDAGIYELRIFYGPGYRIYFVFETDTELLLLCGGDKSSQSRDIARAKRYWQD